MRESHSSPGKSFPDPRTSTSFPKQLLPYSCYISKEICRELPVKVWVQSKAGVIEQECCAVSSRTEVMSAA